MIETAYTSRTGGFVAVLLLAATALDARALLDFEQRLARPVAEKPGGGDDPTESAPVDERVEAAAGLPGDGGADSRGSRSADGRSLRGAERLPPEYRRGELVAPIFITAAGLKFSRPGPETGGPSLARVEGALHLERLTALLPHAPPRPS